MNAPEDKKFNDALGSDRAHDFKESASEGDEGLAPSSKSEKPSEADPSADDTRMSVFGVEDYDNVTGKLPDAEVRRREDAFASVKALVQHFSKKSIWLKLSDGPRHRKEELKRKHITAHLGDGPPFGLCPIPPGTSVTRVLAFDLDSHKGEVPPEKMRRVVMSLAETMREHGLVPHAFVSTGGNGYHLYAVFEKPQDAFSARDKGRDMLAQEGFEEGTKGVAHGQIEIFPKQDSVPADGWGNMIVIPGSGRSRYLDPVTFLPADRWPSEWEVAVPIVVLLLHPAQA